MHTDTSSSDPALKISIVYTSKAFMQDELLLKDSKNLELNADNTATSMTRSFNYVL